MHDYIQWLFPLDEPSRFNPDAPLLTPADRVAFLQPPLAANLRRALDRMLAVLRIHDSIASARRSAYRPIAANGRTVHRNGCSAGNHNLLRLTRIIRSLALLGQTDLAQGLYVALKREGEGRVTAVTLGYWKEATGR